MKRDELVKAIYAGLIEDCVKSYPGDKRSLMRDLDRLLRNVDKLSHFFYACEMPRIGQALRSALERGNLEPVYGVNHCKRERDSVYPRLFYTLWSRVFDGFGGILPVPDPLAIFFLQQFFFCMKKIEGVCTDQQSKDTIDEFFAQESRLKLPSLFWNDDNLDYRGDLHLSDTDHSGRDDSTFELFPSTGTSMVDVRLPERCQLIADIIFGGLTWFNPEEYKCRHGPGAVSDKSRGGDKYAFSVWPSRLDSLFCYDAHATIGLDESPDILNHEHAAKLITVPKDSRGPRLIASEPSYLQFAQQSINAYLRHEIGTSPIRHSVNFTDQGYSQEWAILASQSRSHATVDLKSASDLLSLWMLERLARKNRPLLEAIHATRSRYVTDGSGRYSFLTKVAPMGNAYIFPLQTMVYTIAAIAALSVSYGEKTVSSKSIERLSKEVRVFGDDIILPTRAYGYLVSLLTYMGMQVNTQKSFSEGFFREACGVDAYQGYNVTPVYIKAVPDIESPESVVSCVDCINNLYNKGLYRAAAQLRSLLPRKFRNRIIEVQSGSGAFGYQVSQPDQTNWKVRYNRALQRQEVRCLVPESVTKRREVEGIRNLLQYVTELPQALSTWKSGIGVTRDLEMRSRWVPLMGLSKVG